MSTLLSKSTPLKEKGTFNTHTIQSKLITMKRVVIPPLEMVEVRGLT